MGDPEGYIYGMPAAPVSLYGRPGYFGARMLILDVGTYQVPDYLRGMISSIYVTNTWAVVLYDEVGGSFVLDGSPSEYGDGGIHYLHRYYMRDSGNPVSQATRIVVSCGHCPVSPTERSGGPGVAYVSSETSGVCGGTQVIPPKLRDPADNATLDSRRVTFRWDPSPSPNIQDYEIRIKTVPNMYQGGEQIHTVIVGNTDYTFAFQKDYLDGLFWSVRARNASGWWSEWAPWEDINGEHLPRFYVVQASSVGRWHARYFDNHNCLTPDCATMPYCEENLTEINQNWGGGAPCGMSGDNWGALFTGDFYFPDGDYIFHVNHDDGARLWLDGQNIMDVLNSAEDNYACPPRHLVGNHTLALVYFENGGDARVSLDWSTDTSRCASSQQDTTPPDGHITSPHSPGYIDLPWLEITAQASDAESGVKQVEFVVHSDGYDYLFATDATPASGSTYKAEWMGSSLMLDQQIQFWINVVDNAGNKQEHAGGDVLVTLDRQRPTADITTPTSGVGPDTPHYLTNPGISIQVSASDSSSGMDRVVFQAKYGGTGDWQTIGMDTNGGDGWGMVWTAPDSANNNPLAIQATAYDRASNRNGDMAENLFLDWSKPWSRVSAFGVMTSTQTSFPVTWQGSDNGSGIRQYRIEVRDGPSGSWSVWYEGSDTSRTFNGQNSHTYYFRSRVVDRAGNWEDIHSGPDAQITVAVDADPPIGTVVVNNHDEFTTSRDVNLTLSATDNVAVADMEFATWNARYGWWDWEGPEIYATSRSFTLRPGEGWKTVWARYYDNASNISEWANDSIVLDTVPPATSVYAPTTTHRETFYVFWGGADDYYGPDNPASEYYAHDVPGQAWDVFVEGSYAYVAAQESGLRILDISDPYNPYEVGFVTTSYAEDVYVSGDYAYLADGWDGLRVINVSSRASPWIEGTHNPSGYVRGIKVGGPYAYLAAGSDGLLVLDISNPASPSLEGSYTPANADFWDVAISGNYAYVADYPYWDGNQYAGGGLRVISIANPASPYQVAFYDTSGWPEGIFVYGSHAYLADWSSLLIFDVGLPASPTEVGAYYPDHFTHDVFVAGDYAYLPDEGSGLKVLDVSTPSNPTLIGSADAPGDARGAFIATDAYYGDLAYVADLGGGLQILDVSYPQYPWLMTAAYDTLGTYDVEVWDSASASWQPWLTDVYGYYAEFTGQAGHTYCFRARARDRAGNQEEYQSTGTCTYVAAPEIGAAGFRVDDDTYGESYGNGDGTANAGEFVELQIALENTGFANAQNVNVAISTTDTCVWPDEPYFYDTGLWFADISPGEVRWGDGQSGDDLDFVIASNCPNGHEIIFYLQIYENIEEGNVWYDTVSIPVTGYDTTPPQVWYADASPRSATMTDTVTIGALVREGARLSTLPLVWAHIAPVDGSWYKEVLLYDDGQHSDGEASDRWFANTWLPAAEADLSVIFGASDTYGNWDYEMSPIHLTTRPFVASTDVLLVYDRWDYEYTDPEYLSYYTETLEALGYSYDLWNTVYRGPVPTDTLRHYRNGIVIWAMPTYGYLGYLEEQQAALQIFLDEGGRLFITGQDVGYYMTWGGQITNMLYQDYLHAVYIQDDVNLYGLNGVSGDPVSDGSYLSITGGEGAGNQGWPSEIDAIAPAEPIYTYDAAAITPTLSLAIASETPPSLSSPESSERPDEPGRRTNQQNGTLSTQDIGGPGIGALRVDTGVYRVVYFAFGFEAVNGQGGDSRIEVMDRVLHWLLPNRPPEEPYAPFPAFGTMSIASASGNDLVPEDIILWWTAWDRDPGDFLAYDVYLGTDPNLGTDELLASNLLNSWFDPRPLEKDRTYYWRIVARDNQGAERIGPIWSFSTGRSQVYLPLVLRNH